MKICFVSLAALPYHVAGVPGSRGGAERQVALLAESLRERGHEVSIVVVDYHPEIHEAKRLTDLPLVSAYDRRDGIPIVRFFAPRWTGLYRALARAGADVYFQMCAGGGTGQIAHFCRQERKPFVFVTASDTDVDPKRVRLGFRDRLMYTWGLRHADRIISQHASQAEALRKNYGLDSTPIPLGAVIPDVVPAPASPPVVAWLGTLRKVKRPWIWLRMAERFPEARFVMAGGAAGGEPELFAESKAAAEKLPNVVFRGQVADPGEVLDGAWVLLNTSDVEGFPTTFLEAWARGVPVVSFFDPAGIVKRHGLGIIADDEDSLARALGEVLSSPERRHALGAAGRAHVEREHGADIVADRVEAVLRDAVASARRKG